jgi:hypothetical protein
MRQRLYFIVGLLVLAVNLSVATPLKALDLFSALPIARETCGHKSDCCCRLHIFKCRPEPRYCRPELICEWKKNCVKPLYCKPEKVCKPCAPCVKPKYCNPEPICSDPEPRCVLGLKSSLIRTDPAGRMYSGPFVR